MLFTEVNLVVNFFKINPLVKSQKKRIHRRGGAIELAITPAR